METVPGRIEKDGRVVAGDLEITLDTVTEPSGLKSWYGSLLARAEHALEPDQYELVLADGRRGTILITNMTITGGSGMVPVTFQGSGPLRK